MKELSLMTDILTTRVKGIFRTKCLPINGLVRWNGFSEKLSPDGTGCKTRITVVNSHWLVLVSFDSSIIC